MNLKRYQSEFARSVVGGERRANLEAGILPGGSLSPDAALNVYRRAYVARLTESLGDTFEAVWRVLGDESFFRHAAGFIAGSSSSFYNLSDYGAGFPDYLAGISESADLPFLQDLARFEWEFKELFHDREEPANADAFAALPADGRVRFDFARHARLLFYQHAVYEIWKRRESTDPAALALLLKAPSDRPDRLLLYKSEGDVYAARLDEPEFEAAVRLRRGERLDQVLEDISARFPELTPERVRQFFTLLRSSGIVRGTLQDKENQDG